MELTKAQDVCNPRRPTPVWSLGNSTLWGGSSRPPFWTDTKFSAILNVYADRRRNDEENIEFTEESDRGMEKCGYFWPNREYLYIVGLNPCLSHDFKPKMKQVLIVGLLFLERELFGRGDSQKHVLVTCALGRDRTFAILTFYMCAKFIAMHGGLSHFKSAAELWQAQSKQVYRCRHVTEQALEPKIQRVWSSPAEDLLRAMLSPQWRFNKLSYMLPSIYTLSNASNIPQVVSLAQRKGKLGLSVRPSDTMTIVTAHGKQCLGPMR